MTIEEMKKISQQNGRHFFDNDIMKADNSKIIKNPNVLDIFIKERKISQNSMPSYSVYMFSKDNGETIFINPLNAGTSAWDYSLNDFSNLKGAENYRQKLTDYLLSIGITDINHIDVEYTNRKITLTSGDKKEVELMIDDFFDKQVIGDEKSERIQHIIGKAIHDLPLNSDNIRCFEPDYYDFIFSDTLMQKSFIEFLKDPKQKNFADYLSSVKADYIKKNGYDFNGYLETLIENADRDSGYNGELTALFNSHRKSFLNKATSGLEIIDSGFNEWGVKQDMTLKPNDFRADYNVMLTISTRSEQKMSFHSTSELTRFVMEAKYGKEPACERTGMDKVANSLVNPDFFDITDCGLSWLVAQQGHSLSELIDEEICESNDFLESIADEMFALNDKEYKHLCLCALCNLDTKSLISLAHGIKTDMLLGKHQSGNCIELPTNATVGLYAPYHGEEGLMDIELEKPATIPADMIAFNGKDVGRIQFLNAEHDERLYHDTKKLNVSPNKYIETSISLYPLSEISEPTLFIKGQDTVYYESESSVPVEVTVNEIRKVGNEIMYSCVSHNDSKKDVIIETKGNKLNYFYNGRIERVEKEALKNMGRFGWSNCIFKNHLSKGE